MCVCVSVPALAASASVYILDFDFRKNLPFKSYSAKKAICKCVRSHREPFSRSFGTNETQHLREGRLVGRMLLQRLSTGATGVKQARYRRGPTRAARHSYAHAQ